MGVDILVHLRLVKSYDMRLVPGKCLTLIEGIWTDWHQTLWSWVAHESHRACGIATQEPIDRCRATMNENPPGYTQLNNAIISCKAIVLPYLPRQSTNNQMEIGP